MHVAERVEDIGFYAGFVGNKNFPNDYNVPTSKPSYMHMTNYLIYSSRELVKCHICIFVGASYMLGRALTSTAWGMIADRIGRRATSASKPAVQLVTMDKQQHLSVLGYTRQPLTCPFPLLLTELEDDVGILGLLH